MTNATLKLTHDRLREVFAALCGETTWEEHETKARRRRPIVQPTHDELASIANELLSARFALSLYDQEEEFEASVLDSLGNNPTGEGVP